MIPVPVSMFVLLFMAAMPDSRDGLGNESVPADRGIQATRQLSEEVRTKGWIIYSARTPRGDWDLFACRPDGSQNRNVTRTPSHSEAAPQFSRDGKKLLYRRLPAGETIDGNHYGTQGELVICPSCESLPTVLGHTGEYPWASWSPDGTQIASLTIKGITIVDVASRHTVRTLARKGFFQQLTWSPDGKSFSGVANSFGASWTVARMDVNTGEANAVSAQDCCTPDWFPDSRNIIYSNRPPGQSGNRGYGWTQLWMADADGSNRRLVYGEDGRHLYGGQVSPDGKYVVFTGNIQEDGDPGHAGSPMGLMRLVDAPVIGGESRELRKLHPQANRGPVLVLPAGWEPSWTGAEIPFEPVDRQAEAPREPAIQASAAGAALAPAQGEAALAAELRSKGWISCSAVSDQGDWDLFMMRPDGTSKKQLTRTSEFHEAGVRFSPDGKKMLYYRIPRSEAVDNNTYGTYELVIADADGQNAVAHGRDFRWASWGPDGTRIAFLDRSGIRIVDAESMKELRRLPRKGFVQQLVWSPDGQWFAGTANGLGPYWNIGRMDAKSGQVNAVSETERYNCTPDWMPDSRSILYSRGIVPETGGHAEIWLAGGDGKEKKMLYASENQHLYGSCASPDGKYLLFARSDADLGPVDNSQTSMAIVRMSDAPIVAGPGSTLRKKHPEAHEGPTLSLGPGWEPHWTYADIGQGTRP